MPIEPVTGARRVLACSSGGGHFTQLLRLVDRIPQVQEVTWLTYDTGAVHETLAARGRSDDRVVWAPYAAPRDVVNLARDARIARRLLRESAPDLVVSTGAGIAVAALPQARAAGARACFIESATRVESPSLSGRLLERTPGIELYSQNPGYAARWSVIGSVHDDFTPAPATVERLDRVVVTVGTIQPYGFRRLLRQLLRILPPDVDVLWQTGATDVSGLGIDARARVPGPELEAAIAEADVVVAHAGTGTALTAFEQGKCPVLVPRRRSELEHVDDHQVPTARRLAALGLAVCVDVEHLTLEHLLQASARGVQRRRRPPPLAI